MSDVDDFYYALRDGFIDQFNQANEWVIEEEQKVPRDETMIGQLVERRNTVNYMMRRLAVEKRRFTRMRRGK